MVFEKELNEINCERLKNALVYIKDNLTDSDKKIYLTVDSLIDINMNNLFLRKVNVKSCGYNKMYIDKDLIEYKLY